ncbi:MAG: HEAT repeat domain-containing protein [Candidatus Polarisedimenticolia bacterium]
MIERDPPPRDPADGPETDLPAGIRYDPDLAVHEPMQVPVGPQTVTRRRSPLLIFALGTALLAALVYVLFGLIASEGKSSTDYLGEIRMRGGGAWQAAWELSRLIPLEDPSRRGPDLAPQIARLFDEARGSDARLRRYLALSLKELADPRTASTLAAAVRDDPDVETRLYAAWGLGAIGDPAAAATLTALLEDGEPDLRKIAAHSLGSLGAESAVDDALASLMHDPVEDVAWNAALALARHRDPRGLPLLRRMLDRTYLDGVTRPDPGGRRVPLSEIQKEDALVNALSSVARLRDPAAAPAMRRLQGSDPSLRVREAARAALAALGEPAIRY